MANVTETPSYDAGIYQIETTDPVLGGPNGIANAQAKGLANRTAFLKQQIDQLNSGQLTPSWIASQDYVQGELQKLDAKQSVRAATTANITLSGVQTVDGVVLTVGDRVLVKDQTAAAQNGIYLAAAQGWVRATDADNGTKLSGGARVAVEEGVINSGKIWFLANSGTVNVGSTALVFADEHAPATESTKGVTSYASQSQVDNSIADDVSVTPKKLKNGFSCLLAPTGYIALPSWLKNITIQWGTGTSLTVGVNSNIFPIAFPNRCAAVVGTALNATLNADVFECAGVIDRTSFTSAVVSSGSSGGSVQVATEYRWIAIGY
ncbi:gp53-like domain-containing protein [Aeromonas sp. L_1B5_3]|uniref:gp53-like domain-containing protein n=1 Tax=Aeromonas sp. L_1B5_3 TaxID=1588629 RepID=UPI000A4C0BCD|nr:hypothetical protein [Aeromonas sp. L_1B5_3]